MASKKMKKKRDNVYLENGPKGVEKVKGITFYNKSERKRDKKVEPFRFPGDPFFYPGVPADWGEDS